ncbi:nitroreductase [Candidatus Saganbacteria bacterium]|nr:nitroreductase [Candidatus Saganbacteria bacterium]
MNKIIENIYSRRAIRSFLDKPIPEDLIQEIINAGNMTPSGSNMQPWRFVVVQDKSFREKLVKAAMPKYKNYMEAASDAFKERRKKVDEVTTDSIYYSAPLIIFVIGTKGITVDLDCPMVCENMMLAARSLDIGSCWVLFGSFPVNDEEIKKALELKDGEKVYGPIIFGYPKDGFPQTPDKKPPIVKRI